MKTLKYFLISTLSAILFITCNDNDELDSCNIGAETGSEVPGVVVAHSPKTTKVFLASPSICILDNGDYIASYDLKPQAENEIFDTEIMRSTDKGATWQNIATLRGQFYSQLFVHNGNLYTMGTSKYAGTVLIRKSTDGGVTWTTPDDPEHGLILPENQYATAPTPVIIHNGRVWRTMEDNKGGGDGTWGHSFRAFIMSAPIDADLLKAENWTVSWKRARTASWLGGDFNGWLEGCPVVNPEGHIVNMLRVNYELNGDEMAGLIRIMDDTSGGEAETDLWKRTYFNPENDFIKFPGGCKKFVVKKDPTQNKYWALSNYSPDSQKGHGDVTIERTRNTLALSSSPDLRTWSVEAIVLHHPDRQFHAFQYVDFQFEGEDIIFLSRTAYDDGVGGADSQHNANFITFHRIEDFRNYKSPVLWEGLLP